MIDLKNKQTLYLGGIVIVGITVIGGVLWLLDGDSVRPKTTSQPITETQITTVGQRINPQEIWVERLESENKLTVKKIDTLEKLLKENVKSSTSTDEKYEALLKDLDEKRREEKASLSPAMNTHMSQVLPPPPGSMVGAQPLEMPQGVRKIKLTLANRKMKGQGEKPSATVENTSPAGAFASAVLLGGVDASTSIAAQNDPRPVLLRISDDGTLPRRFKSDLKACHLLASAYGDLSSERVYMRLEKLTCMEYLTGEISETQVAGYVLGEDGRAGIRGVVADRAGPVIRHSLMGGFLSGVSGFFTAQQQRAAGPFTPFGQSNGLDPQEMLSAGASNGLSNALDKYADFFIKRAEQLQPVLQVAAGRSVDVVFTEGTAFGETNVKTTLSKIREGSRQQAIQDLETTTLPPLGE